jgi:UDP-glucose 4-epimerase
MSQTHTVLITGGAGFIGSHVAEAYLERGYQVVIVDNLSSGKKQNLKSALLSPNCFFYHADIRKNKQLVPIFTKHRPNIICHHAAQKSVPFSMIDPIYDAGENIIGLLNLLLLTKRFPIANFLFVSSGGALAKSITGKQKSKESDPPQLASPYAISKYAGENYTRLYAQEFGFAYSILRYANVFGPRQIADGECGVVPIFVNNILANKPSTLMTYNDMPRGCTRDYVFVGDIVEANMILTAKPVNTIVNLGSGKEIPIMDIYETILEVFTADLPLKITGPRAGDIKRSVLDPSLMKKLTGWYPQVTLKKGLKILKNTISPQRKP